MIRIYESLDRRQRAEVEEEPNRPGEAYCARWEHDGGVLRLRYMGIYPLADACAIARSWVSRYPAPTTMYTMRIAQEA